MTHIDTKCIQAGYRPGNGEPRQLPIIQSTTFRYESSADIAAIFDMEKQGYFYSRIQNPTCDNVAAKIAALEGGEAAVLTGSGQSAIFYAVFNICPCGGHLICSSEVYGGTYNLFAFTMRQMGVEVTFVPLDCSDDELRAAFRPNTRAVFGEALTNPILSVLDIERFARIAHEQGVPLIVDNTFPTPINCRPLDWGADIVVHSTTKYMDGHASVLGGVIVDGGKFDWAKNPEKFPELNRPDASYHGVVYADRFGSGAYAAKMVYHLMRDLGAVQAPMNAFMLNLGLESLHLRIKRHCENADEIAKFLAQHPAISFVNHCSLPNHKHYALAQKYLPNGSCGVISFGVKGGKDTAESFMSKLTRCNIATHVSDAQTCVLHPASTTHRQLTDEQLKAIGISPEMVRLSVGIEYAGDLIADLEQALA